MRFLGADADLSLGIAADRQHESAIGTTGHMLGPVGVERARGWIHGVQLPHAGEMTAGRQNAVAVGAKQSQADCAVIVEGRRDPFAGTDLPDARCSIATGCRYVPTV